MKTKRKKLTNFLKLGILFFGISLLLFNCEQREFPEEMETVSIDNKYQNLNIDEVTGFMGDFKAKKSLEKSDEGINLNVDVNSLKFEEVENDDLSIPIFNATTKFTKANSKLFLVKVEGTIKGFLLNKTRKENTSGSKFTGVTIITDLEGNFINGYRVEDDIFISQFVSPKEENKERALLSKMMSEPVFYGGTLDEVIIRSYSGGGGSSGPRGLSFTSIRGGGSQWSHENSTGGSSNGSSGDGNDEDERAGGSAQVFPCNDPLHGCRDIERCGEGYERNNNNECVPIEIEEEDFLEQNVWDTQDPYDKWNKLTECERDFFRSNPQHLYTARGNKAAAEKVAWERFGNCNTPSDRPMLNTIGDAYRHAYFAALNTHNMGHTNAKSLGDAHECDTPSNNLNQKQMDLHNNAWGYHYGSTISTITESQFYTTFMSAFNSNQIKILQKCN
jgi:hypothetical protein